MLTFRLEESEGWMIQFERVALDAFTKARLLLEQVGAETVTYLRSLTSEMRPPALPGEPMRPAHPGHWADVTGNLANAYAWRVERRGEDAVLLILENSMEYAATLEERDGYWVLRGVAEQDGPVYRALGMVAERMGWRVA